MYKSRRQISRALSPLIIIILMENSVSLKVANFIGFSAGEYHIRPRLWWPQLQTPICGAAAERRLEPTAQPLQNMFPSWRLRCRQGVLLPHNFLVPNVCWSWNGHFPFIYKSGVFSVLRFSPVGLIFTYITFLTYSKVLILHFDKAVEIRSILNYTSKKKTGQGSDRKIWSCKNRISCIF